MPKTKKHATPKGTQTRAAINIAAPRDDDDDNSSDDADAAPSPRTGFAMRELGHA